MARIALRNLATRKLRAVLTALAIALGVMMISGTYILTDTIDRSFERIFTQSNEGIDAIVTSREAVETQDGSQPPVPASLLADVERAPGVEAAEGSIADPGVRIIGSDGEPVGGNGAPTFAFSAGEERFDPLTYDEGGPPRSDDQVALLKATADSEGFEIGDEVELAGQAETRWFELAGIATLGDTESFGGATAAVLTLPAAQELTGKQDRFDQISVAAEPGVNPNQLVGTLERELPRSVTIETGAENAASAQQDVGEFIGFLQTALLIFAAIALFVAAFLIFNTFSITVAQRTREFAMLRTLGASRRQIVASVGFEALAIGAFASVVGLLAGLAFAPAITALFEAAGIDLPSDGNVVEARTVVVSLAVGLLVTLAAALIPARRATRIPPVQGLREGAVLETRRDRGRRNALGLVLTALGIAAMVLGLLGVLDPGELGVGIGAAGVFLGIALLSPVLVGPLASAFGRPLERLRGMPARLARENAVRVPGRTAITAAALMIGVALVAFVAIFAAGIRASIDDAIDSTLQGDLIVANTDGFSDIPAAVTDEIAAIDGVATASPLRYTQDEVEGAGAGFLTLVDPATAAEVLTLDWVDGSAATLGELGPSDAVVDSDWASENAIAVGDEFTALTPSGKELRLTAIGSFRDQTDFIGDYAASDENAAAFNEEATISNLFVDLEPGASGTEVRSAIDSLAAERFPTVEAQDQEELKDSIGEQLNTLLGVVYALLGLAVVVSLFGIVNTLALSIHERTRELGLLRAVGTSRSQVRRMVRYESVITALIGAVLGLALGVVFAALVSIPLADEGFVLAIPIGTLAVLLVVSIVAGVLAAIGPARRASRIDVLEALSYE
ncbi:FtsX-like permease family protein [Thermoleophilia bacterium SCSIO 60948]|nr:FtsX-like permease family protein [Thermoleophilia bacterium SCSIO 60948]